MEMAVSQPGQPWVFLLVLYTICLFVSLFILFVYHCSMVAKFMPHGEDRRQLLGVRSLLPPCRSGVSWHFIYSLGIYHVVGIFQTNWCSGFKQIPLTLPISLNICVY